MTNSVATLVCPTCKRTFALQPLRPSMPFCSDQCRLVDLGRWLGEEIGLPHEASDDEAADETAPAPVREWRFE